MNDMTSFKVNSCRAYFHLNGITAGDKNGSVRAFNLNFGDGEQTGMASPKSSPDGKDFSPSFRRGRGRHGTTSTVADWRADLPGAACMCTRPLVAID